MYADARDIQQFPCMVRFSEHGLSLIDRVAKLVRAQRAQFCRHAAISVAEFLSDDDVAWYCRHRGYSPDQMQQLLRGALEKERRAIRTARLMIEAANDLDRAKELEATKQ